MGSCYSFLLSIISASGPQQRQQQRDSVLSCPHSESEMASRRGDGRGHSAVAGSTNGDGSGGGGALLAVDRTMSAPTIHFDGTYISGHGLALASVSIEQDAAYWEYHINNDRHDEDEDDNDNEDTSKIDYEEIRFGVCTAKNQSFYKALNADDGGE